MDPLGVVVGLAGFLFVTEQADTAGNDRVEIPSITERFGKMEKKLVLVKDEPRSGSTPPDVLQRLSESNSRSILQRRSRLRNRRTPGFDCKNRIEAVEKRTGAASTWKTLSPLPQKLRLTLLLGHPTGQDKQRVAEAIQETHEGWVQTFFPPQSHTETFSPSTDRSGLV